MMGGSGSILGSCSSSRSPAGFISFLILGPTAFIVIFMN